MSLSSVDARPVSDGPAARADGRPILRQMLANYQPGWSLPQAFYVDEQVFADEWQVIWSQGWLFVGTTAEIPEPGDFFTYAINKESLIVVRGRAGEVLVHHNTCRHRGSLVCLDERGRTKAFRCPYHQWIYDLDGSLVSARLMPEDFDRTGHGLAAAHVRVAGGLIFVSLSDDPPDFADVQTDFAAYMAPFDLDRAKVAHRERYDLQTNWKLIAENFRECYHCGVVHTDYCRAVIGANLNESALGLLKEKQPQWRTKGLAVDAVPFTGTSFHHAIRYPLRPGFDSYSIDGRPLSAPMGRHADHDAGVVGLVLLPGFWTDALSDHVWTMRVTPLGPGRTVVDATWFVARDAQEGRDYELDRLCAFWRITGGEDWTLCENNFRGVSSSHYRPGPYAPAEAEVAKFVDWYVGTMKSGFGTRER